MCCLGGFVELNIGHRLCVSRQQNVDDDITTRIVPEAPFLPGLSCVDILMQEKQTHPLANAPVVSVQTHLQHCISAMPSAEAHDEERQ